MLRRLALAPPTLPTGSRESWRAGSPRDFSRAGPSSLLLPHAEVLVVDPPPANPRKSDMDRRVLPTAKPAAVVVAAEPPAIARGGVFVRGATDPGVQAVANHSLQLVLIPPTTDLPDFLEFIDVTSIPLVGNASHDRSLGHMVTPRGRRYAG
jgi:hypothetical protein